MNKIFSKLNIVRGALFVAAAAIIVVLLPRADHQSYSYEVHQPWRYPLLTAAFDTPILRDSTSARALKDSIDANFVPFVKRSSEVADGAVARFHKAAEGRISATDTEILANAMRRVYSIGVLDPTIYSRVARQSHPQLRLTESGPAGGSVEVIDASAMVSPAKAFEMIDSLRRAAGLNGTLSEDASKALNICLQPNITLDTVVDSKYRNQEYLNVTGAQGVIKQGQRIVDVGEIITPQIYTNLNTYFEMAAQTEDSSTAGTLFLLGRIIYVAAMFTLLYAFLRLYRWRFFRSIKKMTLLMSLITIFVALALVMFETVRTGLLLVPFAALPVIIVVFFDSRTAIFSLLVTVLLAALVAPSSFNFCLVQLMAGLTATYSIAQLSKRSQLLRAAVLSFVAYVVGYLMTELIANGSLALFSWRTIALFGINSVLLSFAYLLIFIIERVFGFTSTVTLVELSDINNPLLMRLAEEAPGTFQHSMQVSTLAAEAARAIDANTQLVRTGALYHDIGKMESPIFFTENQHGVNPHEGLTPEVSARKIISHVSSGLSLAAKARLPQVIRDFIAQHHGRGITKYFYNTAANEHPGETIDAEPYTYPGPNPASKETAIVMMADSIEAASRSLKDYSQSSIDALVDKIIDSQIADGLFKDSPISLRDIETVKATFKKRLATIYHSRVAYPELKTQP